MFRMSKTPRMRMGGLQGMSRDNGKANKRAERKRNMMKPARKTQAIKEASRSLKNGESFIMKPLLFQIINNYRICCFLGHASRVLDPDKGLWRVLVIKHDSNLIS